LDAQRREENKAQKEIDLQLKRDTKVYRKAQKAPAKEEKATKKSVAKLKSTQSSMTRVRRTKELTTKARDKSVDHIEVIGPEEVGGVTKSGRIRKLPQRFKQP
jgi:hypothetical protein